MNSTRATACNVSYLRGLKWNLTSDHIADNRMLRLCEMRRHSGDKVVVECGISSTLLNLLSKEQVACA
jgi:hypothetical protein